MAGGMTNAVPMGGGGVQALLNQTVEIAFGINSSNPIQFTFERPACIAFLEDQIFTPGGEEVSYGDTPQALAKLSEDGKTLSCWHGAGTPTAIVRIVALG